MHTNKEKNSLAYVEKSMHLVAAWPVGLFSKIAADCVALVIDVVYGLQVNTIFYMCCRNDTSSSYRKFFNGLPVKLCRPLWVMAYCVDCIIYVWATFSY